MRNKKSNQTSLVPAAKLANSKGLFNHVKKSSSLNWRQVEVWLLGIVPIDSWIVLRVSNAVLNHCVTNRVDAFIRCKMNMQSIIHQRIHETAQTLKGSFEACKHEVLVVLTRTRQDLHLETILHLIHGYVVCIDYNPTLRHFFHVIPSQVRRVLLPQLLQTKSNTYGIQTISSLGVYPPLRLRDILADEVRHWSTLAFVVMHPLSKSAATLDSREQVLRLFLRNQKTRYHLL